MSPKRKIDVRQVLVTAVITVVFLAVLKAIAPSVPGLNRVGHLL